jgi:hypothetical protein
MTISSTTKKVAHELHGRPEYVIIGLPRAIIALASAGSDATLLGDFYETYKLLYNKSVRFGINMKST